MLIDFGREICGDLALAESREWLCTNGRGSFAGGTVAGVLTRRYHGLLVAALAPPLGRTLLVAKLDDTLSDGAERRPLFTNRWGGGAVEPHGHRHLERFRLEGTVPVWTYAWGETLVERRVWMEQGADTTHVRYAIVRGTRPLALEVRALVNHRDHHALTRGGSWRMRVEPVAGGIRVEALDGATPVFLLCPDATATAAHTWFERFELSRERERGLDHREDHLHAGTFEARLEPGRPLTFVLSTDPAAATDGEAALERRRRRDTDLVATRDLVAASDLVTTARAARRPAWIAQLTLAADQFVVARPRAADPVGLTVIAGYPWFGDWGRDTMIALPGLTLATGRAEIGARVLRTFAAFVDGGLLPNRFPDAGETPEYNSVDAALWYVEAIRAHHAATGDDAFVRELMPVLERIVEAHVRGTRHGIGVDPADGLLRAGEPGTQLTWMDAKVGDWVVTPRAGKPVEINALWHNALCTMAAFARVLGRSPEPWTAMADRVAESFGRFWNDESGCCFDVVDGPHGDDPSLRPNQVFAVSLPFTPLGRERRHAIVDVCARHLLTSHGLRSLATADPRYRPTYEGDLQARDGAYHQGTVWPWLLGPFALAHYRVHRDRATALSFLAPLAHHLTADGLGTIAEIFDGSPPHLPRGCPAQAWSVAELLRAHHLLTETEPFPDE